MKASCRATWPGLICLTLLSPLIKPLAAEPAGGFKIVADQATGRYTITDHGQPVLTYNFATVPVPAGVTGIYAVARSDYVHPLYGPHGEVLTKDYSPDHPHHRGIYWAWPEVTWKGDKRDLHALQGVFARPVRILRQAADGQGAVLSAENVWKWGDADDIVREQATLRVAPAQQGRRAIDFEFKFEALVEGVTLARREKNHYGGFNIRLSARAQQKIVTHTDAAGPAARAAWACLSGIPPAGKQPVSLCILQDARNRDYPGDWIQFPNLDWLQPTFPAQGTVYELKPGTPLTLRYRLVVADGAADGETLKQLWNEYSLCK